MVEILVHSDDSRIKPVLEEFACFVSEEYEKMRKSVKMRILSRAIPRIPEYMPCVVREHKDGLVLDIPIDVPEMEMIRESIRRYTGRDLGTPKWKKNMCSNLAGYLTKKGIKFDTIEVVE